jgi:hypothetical protein
VRCCEWVAASYFAYIALTAWSQGSERRALLTIWALVLVGLVVAVSGLDELPWRAFRDWAPGVHLLAGYWLPGRLFRRPNEGLEHWLLHVDARLLGRIASGRTQLNWLATILELAYLLCYPLVPAAFGYIYFVSGDIASAADEYWTTVLIAVFLCYGLLPWLPTRPPRAFLAADLAAPTSLRRLNLVVLDRASIRVNTFPSGHVAAAVAAALAVGQLQPVAGIVIGFLASGIAAAAVVGRYHYSADVVLGALAGVIAFVVSR